jgi:hypothetical protein
VTKALVALTVLCALAALGAGVYVVLENRDPVPGDVQACLRDQGLAIARSTDSLGALRVDASAGDLRPTRRWDWGRTQGLMLTGPLRDYAVLALWNPETPSLRTGDVGRRVYDSPERFPVVVVEKPDRKVAAACAEKIEA